MTISQIARNRRVSKYDKEENNRRKSIPNYIGIKASPQRAGIAISGVIETSPKKPNSAKRKIIKVRIKLRNGMTKKIVAYIPGENKGKAAADAGSRVLVCGGGSKKHGRRKDLPGVRRKLVRGVYDCKAVEGRRRGRSQYGVVQPSPNMAPAPNAKRKK